MFDLREHKDLIHSLVAEADKNDTNWEWSVESIDQMNARIRWGYLEYCVRFAWYPADLCKAQKSTGQRQTGAI